MAMQMQLGPCRICFQNSSACFGTELTIELAKLSVNSHAETKKFKDFHVIDPHTEIDFGQATVSF